MTNRKKLFRHGEGMLGGGLGNREDAAIGLEGYHFKVMTDHFSLKWLQSLENPTGRLARWAVALQQHDFEVEYRKGALNYVPDALSRQPLKEGEDANNAEGQELAVIIPAKRDSWLQRMTTAVQTEPEKHPDYRMENGNLYRHFHERHSTEENDEPTAWKFCVPETLRDEVLKECHSANTAGHLGIAKTCARLAQRYYWPGMFR